MATGRTTKLTGAVGEFLVAAELCRRGLLATPVAGNVPHYDIIASGQRGGHVAVQVEAINVHAWQLDVRKFMDVHMDETRCGTCNRISGYQLGFYDSFTGSIATL